MKYSLKSLKTFEGRRGYGFNATLYKDGKKIGTCMDAGDAGPIRYDLDEGEVKELFEYAQKTRNSDYIEEHDMLINDLIDEMETLKKMKRAKKTKTFFKLKEKGSEVVYSVRYPFSEALERSLTKEYGKNLVHIYKF